MKRELLAICFTVAQMKSVQCASFCKFYAGYDTGVYVEALNKCFCQDEVDLERLEEKRLVLPKKTKEDDYEYNPADVPGSDPEPQVITVPYKLPWE